MAPLSLLAGEMGSFGVIEITEILHPAVQESALGCTVLTPGYVESVPSGANCPDADGRDPITVIHALIAEMDPCTDRQSIAAAVHRCAPRPAYQQKLAWALETSPALLSGDGHLAPLRAVPRLIDLLHAAGVAGIVRPTYPRCHRIVPIDKPLDGVRVCRTCIAHSRIQECARCGTRREPVTRDEQHRPLCANCFITDPGHLVCVCGGAPGQPAQGEGPCLTTVSALGSVAGHMSIW